MSTDSSSVPGNEGGSLEVTLAVEPSPAVDCPVVQVAPNAVDASQTLSCGLADCCTCHTELTVEAEDDTDDLRTVHVSTEMEPDCVCSVLATDGCVFTLESVRDGSLIVSVVVRERETVRELVSAIRETGASVSVERIGPRELDRSAPATPDARAITDTQRETIELAVELGYYDEPRKADLQQLADRLDVSRSAVSQRLNAAESKIVRSLVADSSGSSDRRH